MSKGRKDKKKKTGRGKASNGENTTLFLKNYLLHTLEFHLQCILHLRISWIPLCRRPARTCSIYQDRLGGKAGSEQTWKADPWRDPEPEGKCRRAVGGTFRIIPLVKSSSALLPSLYGYPIYFLQLYNTWIISGSSNFSTVNVWICRFRGSIFSLMFGTFVDISPGYKTREVQ